MFQISPFEEQKVQDNWTFWTLSQPLEYIIFLIKVIILIFSGNLVYLGLNYALCTLKNKHELDSEFTSQCKANKPVFQPLQLIYPEADDND